MALRMYSAVPRSSSMLLQHSSSSSSSVSSQQQQQGGVVMNKQQPNVVCVAAGDRRHNYPQAQVMKKRKQVGLGLRRVRASSDVTAVAEVGQVTEVDKDTFWPIVKAAGDKTVVLDMYTQWCGPCKIIAPKFEKLSEKYHDVVFLKLDCNQENRSLAKELGIKVVPTFKILKDSKIVKEVTGAKFDDLVVAIETARSS